MNPSFGARYYRNYPTNRPLDWYCTICDEEMDITEKANHLSTSCHDANLGGIDLGHRNDEGVGIDVEGDNSGPVLPEGQWDGKLEPNPPMSWACTICDITVNIFNRDSHLGDKSHLKKVRKQARDKPSTTSQVKQPPSSAWYCPICEESMNIFYQAEHVAGKQHFKRLREQEDPAVAHIREMFSPINLQDEDNMVHHGAVVHDEDYEMSSTDDEQDTNSGVLLDTDPMSPIKSEFRSVGSPTVVPTNTFNHNLSDGQNQRPPYFKGYSGYAETECPSSSYTERISASLPNAPFNKNTPTLVQVVTPPFQELFCDVCQRGFQKQDKFNIHMGSKKHHTGATAERFYCAVCEKNIEVTDYKKHRSPAWKCIACDVVLHIMWRDGHVSKAGHKKKQLLLEKRMREGSA